MAVSDHVGPIRMVSYQSGLSSGGLESGGFS